MSTEEEQALRRAFGSFATGVTIVSAAKQNGDCVGLTVNSFASVSLSPRLLLWCLGQECDRYDTFAAAESWGVSVLGERDQALALRFARAATSAIEAEAIEKLHEAPVLKAGIAHFACTTFARHIAGDHLVIIGEVMDFRAAGGDALSFFRGRYGAVGGAGTE